MRQSWDAANALTPKFWRGIWMPAKTRLRTTGCAALRCTGGDTSHFILISSCNSGYYVSLCTYSPSMYTGTCISPCDTPKSTTISMPPGTHASDLRHQHALHFAAVSYHGILVARTALNRREYFFIPTRCMQNKASTIIHALWSGASNSAPKLGQSKNFAIFRSPSHPDSRQNGKPGHTEGGCPSSAPLAGTTKQPHMRLSIFSDPLPPPIRSDIYPKEIHHGWDEHVISY
jgi:hypothetical protein